MTSAARPTFLPAVGGASIRDTGNAPLHQVSAKDLIHQTKLKLRHELPSDRESLKEKLLSSEQLTAKKQILNNLDADDEIEDPIEEVDSDDDDSDDEAALLRELQKIKEEKQLQREKEEELRLSLEQKAHEEALLTGNPLLNTVPGSLVKADFSVKRRWDDDVVFKNQGRGVAEKPKKRFINDMLRSDFHRKFMSKYVR